MKLKPPVNPNYAAVVVRLPEKFNQLEKLDRLVGVSIFGCQVIVSKDETPNRIGIFFPAETQLSAEFLRNNNLYRDSAKNLNPEQKGLFEDHGRIKNIKLKGNRSEGFWLPSSCISYIKETPCLDIGSCFDSLGDHEICKKYVTPHNHNGQRVGDKGKEKSPVGSMLVPGQFRFHTSTEQLGRNTNSVRYESIVSITKKYHGTSVVIGNLAHYLKLPWYQRVADWITRKKNKHIGYGKVWASRSVIKGDMYGGKNGLSYYDSDIWGFWADQRCCSNLPAGYTIYGEIVGFTTTGGQIQRCYKYGCSTGNSRLIVYRVTVTSIDGECLELSWPQMKEFCELRGLEIPDLLYYGSAAGFCLNVASDSFGSQFEREVDEMVQDAMDPENPGMPSEGLVVAIESGSGRRQLKQKNFAFRLLETKQNDAGQENMEDQS